jgi:hypothetical protein
LKYKVGDRIIVLASCSIQSIRGHVGTITKLDTHGYYIDIPTCRRRSGSCGHWAFEKNVKLYEMRVEYHGRCIIETK